MSKMIFSPLAGIPIKAIIFDLGGVVINIDYHATINAFRAYGIENFDSLYSQANQSNLFDDFEVGRISAKAFRDGLRAISGMELSDEQIDAAWHAMLLDFPAQRLELLRGIRKHYNTYLLSNTNEIHFDEYSRNPKYSFLPHIRAELFNREYYSHAIGLRKPNPETFMHVLEENNLTPHETLFIDDSIQHIEGASSVGIHTYHLNAAQGETIEELFRMV